MRDAAEEGSFDEHGGDGPAEPAAESLPAPGSSPGGLAFEQPTGSCSLCASAQRKALADRKAGIPPKAWSYLAC